MDIQSKLSILSDSAKYDVSCASSGSNRKASAEGLGAPHRSGICHSFTADGRCVSLLKILFTNFCIYDCSYCINRRSNDRQRAAFTPREVAELTVNFYKRNYIEGLFLSSGIIQSEDHTMGLLVKTLQLLREEYHFNGYIHVKLIPGASQDLVLAATRLADRVSANIELPSERSLQLLAPEKSKSKVLMPLTQVKNDALEHERLPVGMSTQMIIGASPESDHDIMRLSSALYRQSLLKRVYYSAYIPVNNDQNLPAVSSQPPMLREHRLYQADWLLRFYGFDVDELFTADAPNLDTRFDPKLAWALRHLELFPMDINRAEREMLLRVPGLGVRSVNKILRARRQRRLRLEDLVTMKISLKKAGHFLTVSAYRREVMPMTSVSLESLESSLLSLPKPKEVVQPSLFDGISSITGEL